MKLIGRGHWSRVYLQDCGTKVLIKSKDPIKECMAYGWFPESRLFPELTCIDTGMYECKFYPKNPISTLNKADAMIYKMLRGIGAAGIPNCSRVGDRLFAWQDAINNSDLHPWIKSDLCAALDACGNWSTNVMFEISPRNVAVDNGQLVLLDCFFLPKYMKGGKHDATK